MDNTSFLNYYAVIKATGEVIASGKTGWADMGTQKYQEAITQ